MSKSEPSGTVAERRARSASRLARRHRRERLLRAAGVLALCVGLGFLALILGTLGGQGASAFTQTEIDLPIRYDAERLGVDRDATGFERGNFDALVLDALTAALGIADADRQTRRELRQLVSIDAPFVVRDRLEAEPSLLGQRVDVAVPAAANVDMLVKGELSRDVEPERRPLSDRQIGWLDRLAAADRLERRFNTALFTNGDSREPELAGIRGALKGSLLMLVVTVVLAFPVGVAAAVYLEELAPRNRWTTLVEVSINNLAAVPSIIFGLLGLAVLIDGFGLPRSAPLVGGIVLALLTLPVIIIASRASIRNVPASLREAALGLGASRLQVVFHHVMPLALPGILTGTILGLGRALGETAPLLMIGMVAFIVDVPTSFGDPATALPVQIYLWAESPERAFAERTSAAILVLLAMLLALNILAALVRRGVERNR